MDSELILEGRQTLPLPFGDKTLNKLELRHGLAVTPPADWLFLLHEARRVLRPGGTLSLAIAGAEPDTLLLRYARLLGLEATRAGGGQARQPGGTCAHHYRKPLRSVSGEPLVTVAIPAYKPRFFEQCLVSAIAQSYPNLEILICDDSPGHEIEAIARRFATGRRIRYQRNEVRLHGLANYARCFTLAGGEFIKYLNDDDVLRPDCIERLVDAFRQEPDIALATSYRRRIDSSGYFLPDQPATRPLVDRDMILNGVALAYAMLMAGLNVVGEPSTTLFRKSDLQRAIPEAFRFESETNIGIIDMAMWSVLLLVGDVVYLREDLSYFRIHADQRQRDPSIQTQGARNIRNLQAAWLGHGLFSNMNLRRDQFLARSFPDSGQPWQRHGFPAATQLPPAHLWKYY